MATTTELVLLTYEDALRALGWYLDCEQLHNINLTVRDDAYELLARAEEDDEAVTELLLTVRDVNDLRRTARRQRGRGLVRRPGARPSRLTALRGHTDERVPLSSWLEQTQTLGYQDVLRIIGHELDRRQVRSFRLDEYNNGFVLRIGLSDMTPELYEVRSFSKEDLRTNVADALRRRGEANSRPPS
jgi:hypothetical protein